MKIRLARSALAVVAAALASVIIPTEPMVPSAWAGEFMVLPDGPAAGEIWSPETTPHLVEPLDALGPDSPVNEMAVMKSAQSAFTTMLIAALGHSIDRDPCRMMVVQPTQSALNDFTSEKLNPVIKETKPLKRKIAAQRSRSSEGSTARTKSFPGGSVKLAIASSSADLRAKTIKKAFLDEIDEYDDDLDGQGSPLDMVEVRQESFLTSGEWKRAYVSTPTIKGASNIESAYEAGDQRKWHVRCPGCSERFVFTFDRQYFKFNDQFPWEAHYVTPCCGTIIDGYEKTTVYLTGEWIATAPRPGAYPSYHFDALSSPFVPWDKIAERFIKASGDPKKLKTFWNLTLGLPFEVKGDAPDHKALLLRRDHDLKRGAIPPSGIILTIAADVQMRGIWYEVLATSPDRQTWPVDVGYLDGDTSDPERGAFEKLTALYERRWPDAFGKTRWHDGFGVDSGYRSHVVYSWVRGRPNAYALDGRDGWNRPALGAPTAVDINYRGKRTRRGVMLWPVGTWSLKAAFYAELRKEGIREGHDIDPAGYCHFGGWMDEVMLRQITSEYLDEEMFRGRARKVWKVRSGEENHLLDCRIYNMALTEHLGLSTLTDADWARLAAERGVPDALRPDLFSSDLERAARAEPVPQETPSEPQAQSHTRDKPRGSSWVRGGRDRNA